MSMGSKVCRGRHQGSCSSQFCRFRGVERHRFEYPRHGTLSCAALEREDRIGKGKTTQRSFSAEFIGFLTELLRKAKWARDSHRVGQSFGAQNPGGGVPCQAFKLQFHFTPT